MIDGDRKH